MSTETPCSLPEDVRRFVFTALSAAGTTEDPALAVTEALTEASLRGVDSHGIRLLPHYVRVVRGGRINPAAKLGFRQTGPGTGIVDGDNGFGHYASYFAMDRCVDLARESGVGAVSVIHSSHFGAAGSYVLSGAAKGFVAIGTCNSDSFVLLHDGTIPFHGTNPLTVAAPVPDERPFLMDMATSVIPWNRVQDLRMKQLRMPPDVAVDQEGEPTRDPEQSVGLLPLGGLPYGYKGAALASVAEVLSAVMTGMPHCKRLLPMGGDDISTHRHLGHFFIAIDPSRFIPRDLYEAGMRAYLRDLRSQSARAGKRVMAPGDREWETEHFRATNGIPISQSLENEFNLLAGELNITPLKIVPSPREVKP